MPRLRNIETINEMELHDSLPPRVKARILMSDIYFLSGDILETIKRQGEDAAIALIGAVERYQTPMKAQRNYGPDHPQAAMVLE